MVLTKPQGIVALLPLRMRPTRQTLAKHDPCGPMVIVLVASMIVEQVVIPRVVGGL